MIILERVSKWYDRSNKDRVVAVDGVNLVAEPGRCTCVLGPNGSGKSTILLLAGAVLNPDQGRVLRDGRCAWPQGIGLLHQDYRRSLFPWLSLKANAKLALGSPVADDGEERIKEIFCQLGISSLSDRLPRDVSGGQAQLSAIARAILAPGPLMLDEPHSGLDLRRAISVNSLVRSLVRVRSVPCISAVHNIDYALSLADRVYVLSAKHGYGHVVGIIDVDLTEKDRMELSSPQIGRYRAEVLKALAKNNDNDEEGIYARTSRSASKSEAAP